MPPGRLDEYSEAGMLVAGEVTDSASKNVSLVEKMELIFVLVRADATPLVDACVVDDKR